MAISAGVGSKPTLLLVMFIPRGRVTNPPIGGASVSIALATGYGAITGSELATHNIESVTNGSQACPPAFAEPAPLLGFEVKPQNVKQSKTWQEFEPSPHPSSLQERERMESTKP